LPLLIPLGVELPIFVGNLGIKPGTQSIGPEQIGAAPVVEGIEKDGEVVVVLQ